MTLAEVNRMIRAAIRAARQEGVPVVEVTIDNATVRIPLVPDDKPIASAASWDDAIAELEQH